VWRSTFGGADSEPSWFVGSKEANRGDSLTDSNAKLIELLVAPKREKLNELVIRRQFIKQRGSLLISAFSELLLADHQLDLLQLFAKYGME
jgi:hypothetical protein